MAKLKGIIERLEDVDEAHRPLYIKIEKGDNAGKFMLDTDLQEEKASILANKNELLAEKKRLQAEADRYKDIGDPEAARKALAKVKEIDEQTAAAEGNWEKLKTQMVTDHQKELDKLKKEKEELIQSVNFLAVDAEVARLMSSDEELRGASDLLLPMIRANVRAKQDPTTKKWGAEVLKDGGPRVVGTEGKPMALRDYLIECKADPILSRAFDGTNSSGGGASGEKKPAGGGANAITSRSQLKTDEQKSAFIDAHGLAEFQKLPA